MPSITTLDRQLGQLDGLEYAQKKYKGEGEAQYEEEGYEATCSAAEDKANGALPPPPAPRNPSDMSESERAVYLAELVENLRADLGRHWSSANHKVRLMCCLGGLAPNELRELLYDGKRSEVDISNLVSMFHVHQVGAGSYKVWKGDLAELSDLVEWICADSARLRTYAQLRYDLHTEGRSSANNCN
jgi:hypothetical protein